MKNKAFISGALTGVPNPEVVKANYELIGQLCEDFGWEAYVPHKHTDPEAHPHVSARQVYEMDKYHICTSDLVIAYTGITSFGVGQEVEIAREHGIPVILLCEQGHSLSRMTRGSPGVIAEIRYNSMEEALHQLVPFFERPDLMRQLPQVANGRG